MSFKRHEWDDIVNLLGVKPGVNVHRLRLRLELLRLFGREGAGIEAKRHREAIADLRAARDALGAAERSLVRVLVDAAPEAHRMFRQQFALAQNEHARGRIWPAESLAMLSIQDVLIDEHGLDAAMGELFADPEDVRRFTEQAAHLRTLIGAALRKLGRRPKGRPSKADRQYGAISALAALYERFTGRRATSTETGKFCHLVRLVLGVQKAGDLVRAAKARDERRAEWAATQLNVSASRGAADARGASASHAERRERRHPGKHAARR